MRTRPPPPWCEMFQSPVFVPRSAAENHTAMTLALAGAPALWKTPFVAQRAARNVTDERNAGCHGRLPPERPNERFTTIERRRPPTIMTRGLARSATRPEM